MDKTVLNLIGNTPIIRLSKIDSELPGNIYLKLESFNPMSSVKDRLAMAMIEDAEKRGVLTNETTIVEATSGNTGIALAYISAQKGYKLILTMPETMSIERRKLLAALGVEIVLTEGAKGMKGAIDKAKEIAGTINDSIILDQFSNKANAKIHYDTTGPEIWDALNGNIDIFIAGVGTGGTFTGTSEFLKFRDDSIKTYAVEPVNSSVIAGNPSGPHKIQGIGAGFIPEVLNVDLIDEIIAISDDDAGKFARQLAKVEGVLSGISSGANLAAAVSVASRTENAGKSIVTIAPDTGERYLSTWLYEE